MTNSDDIMKEGARLSGRLDPNTGKAMIAPIIGDDDSKRVAEFEKRMQGLDAEAREIEEAKEPEDLDERTAALHSLIIEKITLERTQIVKTIMGYAEDCQERAEQLELSGRRERKRLRRTGHVEDAERIKEVQDARASAFKVRAAIAADIAFKIESGWGRNDDGTPQEKFDTEEKDVLTEARRLNEEAAHLKRS